MKLSPFTDNMILYIFKNPKASTKKLLQIIHKFNKFQDMRSNTKKKNLKINCTAIPWNPWEIDSRTSVDAQVPYIKWQHTVSPQCLRMWNPQIWTEDCISIL